MTIQELREARNKAWEGAKAFVESKRDKDGLRSEEDAKTYADMEKKIKNYSTEIERMEQMEALENELSKPVNVPIVTKIYTIKVTDQADNDIRNIYEYIAYELQLPENASGQLDRIGKRIPLPSAISMTRRLRLVTQPVWLLSFGANLPQTVTHG